MSSDGDRGGSGAFEVGGVLPAPAWPLPLPLADLLPRRSVEAPLEILEGIVTDSMPLHGRGDRREEIAAVPPMQTFTSS